MAWHNFNFAQPLWLLGIGLLPLGWWLWRWRQSRTRPLDAALDKYIDPILQAHLLIPQTGKQSANATVWPLVVGMLLCFALASPRWHFHEFTALPPEDSVVVVMDLSESMNAADLHSKRIERSKQLLADLIQQAPAVNIGVVGFAKMAHIITPITQDHKTIKNLLPAIDTQLIQKQGHNLVAALQQALALLNDENRHGHHSYVLLLTDGDYELPALQPIIDKLHQQKVHLAVLGLGTLPGAPYPTSRQSWHKTQGTISISKLQRKNLQQLAQLAHGSYAEWSALSSGLDHLIGKFHQQGVKADSRGPTIRNWYEQFHWWVIAAMLIFIRRGAHGLPGLVGVMVGLQLLAPNSLAADLDWLHNKATRAKQAFADKDYHTSAQLFQDPYQKGVAHYRAQNFAAAEEAFQQAATAAPDADTHYNLGNSLMMQHKWQQAIGAYEHVLTLAPAHANAQHNLTLAKRLQQQDPKSQDTPPQEDCGCEGMDNTPNTNDQATSSNEGNKDNPTQNSQIAKAPNASSPSEPSPEQQASAPPTEQATSASASPQASPPSQAGPARTNDSPDPSLQASRASDPQSTATDVDAQDAIESNWVDNIEGNIGELLQKKFQFEEQA